MSKYQRGSGATLYAVRYRTPDHRTTYKRGFRTKKLAEAYANGVEVKKLMGEFIPAALGRITVDELAADWLARPATIGCWKVRGGCTSNRRGGR